MNWDEEAVTEAKDRIPLTPIPPGLRPMAVIRENEGRTAVRQALVRGARWQRDQLRTDDAVERVAEAMHENDCGCGDGTDDWYRGLARTAVNALLGEENGRADP